MSLSIEELFSDIDFKQVVEIENKLYADFQKNKLNPSADFDDNSNAAAYLFFEKLRAASREPSEKANKPSKLLITPESLQAARERQLETEFLLGLFDFYVPLNCRHLDTQIATKTPEWSTEVVNRSGQLSPLVDHS